MQTGGGQNEAARKRIVDAGEATDGGSVLCPERRSRLIPTSSIRSFACWNIMALVMLIRGEALQSGRAVPRVVLERSQI